MREGMTLLSPQIHNSCCTNECSTGGLQYKGALPSLLEARSQFSLMGELNTAQLSSTGEVSLPGGWWGRWQKMRGWDSLKSYGLSFKDSRKGQRSLGNVLQEVGREIWVGKSKVPKQLFRSLGPDGDSEAGLRLPGVALCSVRGLLEFQGLYTSRVAWALVLPSWEISILC